MGLLQIAWHGVDWIYTVQDTDKWWAVVKMVTKLQIP
jgi:hypothetical protein